MGGLSPQYVTSAWRSSLPGKGCHVSYRVSCVLFVSQESLRHESDWRTSLPGKSFHVSVTGLSATQVQSERIGTTCSLLYAIPPVLTKDQVAPSSFRESWKSSSDRDIVP